MATIIMRSSLSNRPGYCRFTLCCRPCWWRVKLIVFVMVIWTIWNVRTARKEQQHTVVVPEVARDKHKHERYFSYSNTTTAAATTLSDEEWKSLLDVFQYMFMFSEKTLFAREPDEWLPVIINSQGQLLCKKEHLKMVREFQRFRLFAPMMYDAINFDARQAAKLQLFNLTTTTKLHLPLVERTSVPLILGFGDMRDCFGHVFPRLSWSTVPDKEPCRAFAIPGYNLYLEKPGHSRNWTYFHSTNEKRYPWSSKLRKAMWRGAATGNAPTGKWESLPRAQLVSYSIRHPQLLDAALTGSMEFGYQHPGERGKLRRFSRFAPNMKMNDFQRYRAIVDIDGNAWSARFGELLCMNSVVIKIQPRNKNYFFDDLEPWVHYIPVQSDMSDLMAAIRFAVSDRNVKKVKSIIYQANEWCRTHLTQQRMVIHLFWTLNSYIELLGNDSKRWRQWEKLLKLIESQGKLAIVNPKEFGYRFNNSWLYQPLSHPIPFPIEGNTRSFWTTKMWQ